MNKPKVKQMIRKAGKTAGRKAVSGVTRLGEAIQERIDIRRDKKWIEEAIAEGEALAKQKAEKKTSYHEEWGPFTKKLKEIMDEYPTIPVVILSQSGMNADNVDCSVDYVYDDEGEFREKIITVHKKQRDSYSYGYFDEDDDEIPF